jgi:NADH-quinone oxidoreductase subunit L
MTLARLAAEAPGAGNTLGPFWLCVVLPLAGFVVNGLLALFHPRAKQAVSLIGPGVVLAAFAIAVVAFLRLQAPGAAHAGEVTLWHWMGAGDLHLDLTLRLDRLSAVLLLVVTGVGGLIHLFSVGYMREDEGYARYFAYLNLFVAFMLVLILGASMPVLFIGWEGVGLCSYLLIGFWFDVEANANAGKKAFLMNRIGDFGFLIAMFITWHALGTLDFAAIAETAPGRLEVGGTVVTVITLFMFLGCVGKSAQIPLYTWLPDAMAGPTPVSALIHAATMVTAGVYLVARSSVLFAMAPTTSTVVAGIGALTALFAATIGLRQNDIKKVLAYSTVSQLGYMFLAVGSGAYVAGIFHLVTHAFFKALLFLGSGSVIHAMHHAYHATHRHDDAQDMRNMGGLRRWMPWTSGLMWVATLAIAGVPLFAGFFSKDEILAAAFMRGHDARVYFLFYGFALAAALVTAFYMARLMAMTFHGANRTGEAEQGHLHEAPWIMTGPLAVLGVLSAVGGAINLPAFLGQHGWLEGWLEPVLEGARQFLTVATPHGSTEWILIGAAVAIGAVGLFLGFTRTLATPIVPAREAAESTGVARLLEKRYFVDELYDTILVRPIQWFSRVVLWKVVDQALVDGIAVRGSARLLEGVGWVGSRLQTGQVGLYLLLFVAGAVWVLGFMLGV